MKTCPVYNAWWRIPGPCVHSFLPPPIAVPPAIFPMPGPSCLGLEGPARMKWLLSSTMTSTVQFDGHILALNGHNVGTAIPHVLFPPNAGIALAILFSKYKIMFSASTVLANKKEVSTHFPGLLPPLFCCNPFAMPAIAPNMLIPFPFTVWINTNAYDVFCGVLNIAFEMATDLFFNYFFGNKGWNPLSMVKATAAQAAAKIAKYEAAKAAEEAAKEAAEQGSKELAKVLEHAAEEKAAAAGASAAQAAKAAAKKYWQNTGKNVAKAAAKGQSPANAKAPVVNKPPSDAWKAK